MLKFAGPPIVHQDGDRTSTATLMPHPLQESKASHTVTLPTKSLIFIHWTRFAEKSKILTCSVFVL